MHFPEVEKDAGAPGFVACLRETSFQGGLLQTLCKLGEGPSSAPYTARGQRNRSLSGKVSLCGGDEARRRGGGMGGGRGRGPVSSGGEARSRGREDARSQPPAGSQGDRQSCWAEVLGEAGWSLRAPDGGGWSD